MIKFAATAFLTFAVASKAVSYAGVAVRGLTLLLWALRGHAFSTSGVFGVLATSVRTYQAASIGAAGTTNIFTGALATLRGALYAVNAALGPVGWILIGLSLLVAGGLHLWNKYTQSLQKTPKLSNKIEDSTAAVNKKIRDQAEALKAAGKAAAKNLQPFDEINQLQKEMATGTDYLDAINEALDLDAAGISLPPIAFDEFLESLEEIKPSFSGFLKWLWDEWEGWVQSWDWVGTLSNWLTDTFYDAEQGIWSLKKAWGIWSDYVQDAGWVQATSDWIVENFYDAEQGVWSLNKTWDNWKENVQNWGWVQATSDWIVENFFDAEQGVWSLNKTWDNWKKNVQNWGWVQATSDWLIGNFYNAERGVWSLDTAWGRWKANVQNWGWVQSLSGWLVDNFYNAETGIWELGKAWDGVRKKWDEIKGWPLWKWISDKVNWLKNVFNFKWSLPKIKLPRFTVSWSTAGLWGSIGKFLGLPGKPIIDVTWLAKGGILTRPTLFGGGEAGPEAVIPLTGSVFDDLADRLAAALQKTQLAGATLDGPVTIYLQVDKTTLGKVTARSLRELQRQSGVTVIPV